MDLVEIKTSELIGPALDWVVAKAAGHEPILWQFKNSAGVAIYQAPWAMIEGIRWQPSTDWSQGGPLIEKYRTGIYCDYTPAETITANVTGSGAVATGDTFLVAACRAIVASKLGDTVQVPKELLP